MTWLWIYLTGVALIQIVSGLSGSQDKSAGMFLSVLWPPIAAAVIVASPFLLACLIRKMVRG